MLTESGGIGEKRGTGILVADRPQGPYRDHSRGPVTPRDWECLDGTFYQDEDGQNWLVFCQEWTEIEDGTLNAVPLSADLTRSIGEPVELVRASSMDWVRPFHDPRTRQSGYLTDAPCVFRTPAGTLLLLWSSYSNPHTHHGGYTVAVLKSETGKMTGPWMGNGNCAAISRTPRTEWSGRGFIRLRYRVSQLNYQQK
ncbi:family 43 glycosylhydrolase [Atopococcus tabaci]|uniref:family 43 glycosylhydrolase n=1 Tax=Atopococcus tabaci TaxID=269774 RepID=UPI002409BDB8|nr:family 43 glycosylhydrolase [Atopococcus tabaci]